MTENTEIIQAPELLPAEKNVMDTQKLVTHMKSCFVHIGGLLKENKDKAYWSQAGFENWRDYVEQLGIGEYSMATRLIKVYEIVTSQLISEADVYEIGMAKMALLLPLARDGAIDGEVVELAKNCTNRELREKLGHKVVKNDEKESVVCSHCGAVVTGAKWVRKNESKIEKTDL